MRKRGLLTRPYWSHGSRSTGIHGVPVSSPPQRIPGLPPRKMGAGSTVRIVAIIHFLIILGRTHPYGEITNLRLFGTAGIPVKVGQPATGSNAFRPSTTTA